MNVIFMILVSFQQGIKVEERGDFYDCRQTKIIGHKETYNLSAIQLATGVMLIYE